ncbi:hypothetical protein DL96DRAFT_892141 [Flagelloscypha sp. PMI_526]|nr:hypothetical protein DL96DRAFT_892141 [Flagelloscypha sp. PMI_526]
MSQSSSHGKISLNELCRRLAQESLSNTSSSSQPGARIDSLIPPADTRQTLALAILPSPSYVAGSTFFPGDILHSFWAYGRLTGKEWPGATCWTIDKESIIQIPAVCVHVIDPDILANHVATLERYYKLAKSESLVIRFRELAARVLTLTKVPEVDESTGHPSNSCANWKFPSFGRIVASFHG